MKNPKKIPPAICNKCGLEVHIFNTQESILLLNSMHTFSASFEYCGKDDDLDMMATTFTLCQDCLLSLFSTFKHGVIYSENNSWVIIDER